MPNGIKMSKKAEIEKLKGEVELLNIGFHNQNENIDNLKKSINGLENRVKKLECPHREYSYNILDPLYSTYPYFKECKECGKIVGFKNKNSWLADKLRSAEEKVERVKIDLEMERSKTNEKKS
jgi:hypothetical protein